MQTQYQIDFAQIQHKIILGGCKDSPTSTASTTREGGATILLSATNLQ